MTMTQYPLWLPGRVHGTIVYRDRTPTRWVRMIGGRVMEAEYAHQTAKTRGEEWIRVNV